MKRNKITVVLLAIFIALFAVSSASAYILNARSEEMTANSTCDFAGTIQMFFGADDYNIIDPYLTDGNLAVVLRVSLSGTDIDLGAQAPKLCKDISGSFNPDENEDGKGDTWPTLPIGMVSLDEVGIEVSNLSGGPDFEAYVKGNEGNQYFTIYILSMEAGATNTDPYWIKVGLWEELKDLPGGEPLYSNETTAICADVRDFSGFSKLTVSIDNTPQTLTTTTSENQIGHFLVESIDLRECDKIEDNTCATTRTIQLCEGVEGQTTCLTGTACFVVDGDLPDMDSFVVDLRTNGESSGANTQAGVYITSVSAYYLDATDTVLSPTVYYYDADMDPEVDKPLTEHGCEQEPILARVTFPKLASGQNYGSKIQFCVTYGVKPELAAAGTKARIWTKAATLPCGDLWTKLYEAAELVECGGAPGCMYFPYVVSGIQPWAAGVVVTNLASADVPAEDMIVTFTMTDAAGNVFSATKDDFDSVVYSFVVDDVLEAFGWSPAPGNAWLKVNTNFSADGYSFLTNGAFGAGTLPRQSCSD